MSDENQKNTFALNLADELYDGYITPEQERELAEERKKFFETLERCSKLNLNLPFPSGENYQGRPITEFIEYSDPETTKEPITAKMIDDFMLQHWDELASPPAMIMPPKKD